MTASRPARRAALVGVATGTPDGGVAIVRLSGPDARVIGRAVAGALPADRRLVRREITLAAGARPSAEAGVGPDCGGGVEMGLVVAMPGPESFTGEDVVELHVHAGERNVAAVVQACLSAGARAAGPGDFTRRAFELGRVSLEQAEGIAAVVGAQTDAALAQARRLASGELGREVEAQRAALLELRAEIEANLDFPEDVDPGDVRRFESEVAGARTAIGAWLDRFEMGRRQRERARVVLAGPVNAGKSSLFNALLGQERAIVAVEPGTTRDYVEAPLRVGPYECTLVDTAGLRAAPGAVERDGVRRSEDQVAGADIVLWVEASNAPPSTTRPAGAQAHRIEIESKRDLGTTRPRWLGVSLVPSRVFGGATAAEAAAPEGIGALLERLSAWFGEGSQAPWIGLARHRDRASEAVAALDRAALRLGGDAQLELAAFDLAQAHQRLGEITGNTAVGPVAADVLEAIFSRFCIGK